MVKTQAQTMLRATPQRTADALCNDPTPIMEPVTVCVVDTGMPNVVAMANVMALEVSAQNPPTGFNLVIRIPIVLTIRQPPHNVPSAMTRLHETMTHNGT